LNPKSETAPDRKAHGRAFSAPRTAMPRGEWHRTVQCVELCCLKLSHATHNICCKSRIQPRTHL
jgi:hypothetical protein